MLLLFIGLATAPLWLTQDRAVSVPGAGNHDLDAVRAGLQPAVGLRRPALVRTRRRSSGIGAYAFGLLQLKLWPNLWFDLVGAVGSRRRSLGALVAAFISHRRGIYYALLTIAFGQVFWFVAIKWHSVTGGEDGLLNIKRLPADFGVTAFDLKRQPVALLLCLGAFRAGRALRCGAWSIRHSVAILTRDQAERNRAPRSSATTCGCYKWIAFTLSAAVAGLAGALFAMAQQSAYPNVMSLQASGFVVMMVLIGGGLVSFWGPVMGAPFFILARDLLGAYTETWLLWYGLLFMGMVLWQPEGIAGIWQAWRRTCARAPVPAGSDATQGCLAMALFEATTCTSALATRSCSRMFRWRSRKAACTGIMGPNGAGKTTCFNCADGTLPARSRRSPGLPAT